MPTGEMRNEEYVMTQQRLLMIAAVLRDLRLDEFLRRVNLAESAGPILDPTLYQRAGDNLRKIRELASAAMAFKKEVEQIGDWD